MVTGNGGGCGGVDTKDPFVTEDPLGSRLGEVVRASDDDLKLGVAGLVAALLPASAHGLSTRGGD